MSTGTKEKPATTSVMAPFQPFTLEIGDCNAKGPMVNRKNRGILMQTVKMKLRGRFSFGNQRGRTFGQLAGMPDVAGQFIEIKPNGRRIRIFDPFDPDEENPGDENYKSLLKDINATLEGAVHGHFKVEATSEPKLNEHQFKTFVRELIQWDESQNIYKFHVGQMPTIEQCDKLPGEYMCNHYHSGQVPRFESEWGKYLDNLQRIGAI